MQGDLVFNLEARIEVDNMHGQNQRGRKTKQAKGQNIET